MFDQLSEKFSNAFKHISGKNKISESNIDETLKEVKTALLEADVNFKVVKNFITAVKEKSLGEKVIAGVNPGEQFIKIVHDELAAVMGNENEALNLDRPPVIPILIVGLNGAGKTTFSGKLAYFLNQKHKKDILLVPADTFRPAAKDQLMTLAKSIGIDCFDSDLKLPPEKIAKLGIEEARRLHKDVVIIDTAGRLHIDQELMGQIKEVKRAIADLIPEVLFVADAMTGQEAVDVAKSFHEAIGLTGVVLSKMDSDARGGAALSIRYATGVPIRFVSIGEKMKDLELFHPDRLAKRILDMGDVLTLVEKAEEVIDEKEAEKLMQKMEKNRFTINDFMQQMEQMSKLGSMTDLLKMIPGMGGMLRQLGDISPAEAEMKKIKAMIGSMTKKEREDHTLLNQSRKNRIAKGSGTTLDGVNGFVKRFEQMRSMMSGMLGQMMKGGMPNLGAMMGGGGGMGAGPKTPKIKVGKGKIKKTRGPFGGGYF